MHTFFFFWCKKWGALGAPWAGAGKLFSRALSALWIWDMGYGIWGYGVVIGKGRYLIPPSVFFHVTDCTLY